VPWLKSEAAAQKTSAMRRAHRRRRPHRHRTPHWHCDLIGAKDLNGMASSEAEGVQGASVAIEGGGTVTLEEEAFEHLSSP
jgi:hypothetical protein